MKFTPYVIFQLLSTILRDETVGRIGRKKKVIQHYEQNEKVHSDDPHPIPSNVVFSPLVIDNYDQS